MRFSLGALAALLFGLGACGVAPLPEGWDRGEIRAWSELHLGAGDPGLWTPGGTFPDFGLALDASVFYGGWWWDGAEDSRGGLGTQRAEALDLSDPGLRAWARALDPALLRLGGTEADHVWIGDDEPSPERAPHLPYRLTRDRWQSLTDFAQALGVRLWLTLNAGPGLRDADGVWRSDNAARWLAWAAETPDLVAGWELGNEPNAFAAIHGLSGLVWPAQYARDAVRLGEALGAAQARLRGETALSRPAAGPGESLWRFGGPGSAFWPVWGEWWPYTPEVLRALDPGHFDPLIFHYYPQQSRRGPIASRRAGPEVFLDPAALDEVARLAARLKVLAPDSELWLGETGSAQFGGEPGLSDTYLSTLWWADQSALAGWAGVSLQIRQSLVGGDYALLGPDRQPRPDFWAARLLRGLTGGQVSRRRNRPDLGAALATAAEPVRVYRVDQPGRRTYLVLNLDPFTALRLTWDQAGRLWLAEPPPGQALGPILRLNGRPAGEILGGLAALEGTGSEAAARRQTWVDAAGVMAQSAELPPLGWLLFRQEILAEN